MPIVRTPKPWRLLVVLLALTACATPPRLPAVPVSATSLAQPVVPNSRFFPDRDSQPAVQGMIDAARRERAWLESNGHTGPLPPASYLAISGGGGDGAFGAGLLTGWTEAGTRPEFKHVTGVSTGALIAPFAFLGSKYDPILRETYTQVTDKDIFTKRSFTAVLFNDALADTTPMQHLVNKYVTRELLDAIAAEYAKGRLLFVGTTNLDAREPVYWDMGAIASSKDPAAIELFRSITLASASIPGAFPPVMIDVTVDGQRYQEMHVDGGATRQVFLYPLNFHLQDVAGQAGLVRTRNMYILRNARLDPEWASVDRRTLSIMGRAVSSLIQTQGMGDLYRMYLASTRDGLGFNLAYIPHDFQAPKGSEFDPAYMVPLFERGRELGRSGYRWNKYPPGYEPQEEPGAPPARGTP